MSLETFYISWVDILAVIAIGVGIRFGRKRGMSEEILFVSQWVTILVVAGFGYAFVGYLIAKTGVFSILYANMVGYLLIGLVIMLIFSTIRGSVGDKLVEGDTFGRGEYYLGMGAGAVRSVAIILTVMALLNAREYSDVERRDQARYQEQNFGTQMFPTMVTIQDEVFTRSFSGRWARAYVSPMLIAPTPATQNGLSRTRVRARERQVDEILER